MTDAASDLELAAEFPAATRDDWLKALESVLKGAPFEKRLVSVTADGLAIQPIYPGRRDVAPLPGRAPGAPWGIVQRIDHPDVGAANAQALDDLAQGASGLSLVFAGSTGAHGYGLAPTEHAVAHALSGVLFDAGVSIDLDIGPQSKDAPFHLAKLVKASGVAPAAATIRFGFDPLGSMARLGGSPMRWPDAVPHFARFITSLAADGFKGPFAVADGRPVHDAGGSEAQELAFVLASALGYMRALEAGGVAPKEARAMVYFRLAADADQFLTMAKFRAVRRLWARVEEACGLTPAPALVTAETAWRMMTRRDPWVNLLRTTVAVLAAGCGGADAVTVLPFTNALGLPDAFARRTARNTQIILIEESHLGAVADPAAGTGGIEGLTDELCTRAWALFQEIETAGGLFAALEQRLVQGKVAAVRAERQKNVARRKDALTGTSEFPLVNETDVAVLDTRPVALPPLPLAATFEALAPMRLAEPFEELRDAADAALVKTGARPKVFLANLGPIAAFTARATFAKNFFEAGGIEAVSNDGFLADGHTDLGALVSACKASGAKVACLCSSDDLYGQEAVAAAKALKGAGIASLWLAGRPGDLEAALKEAGVDAFIFLGMDALAVLRDAHKRLGLA